MCSSGSEWQSVIDNDSSGRTESGTAEEKPAPAPGDEADTPDTPDAPATPDTPEPPAVAGPITIGVFTDAHYSATKEDTEVRCYKASKDKIEEAVGTFNKEKVGMVISLGDIVDNEYDDYDDIGSSLKKLEMPVHQILGNHDFVSPFEEELQSAAIRMLGITDRYFSMVKDGIRFLFLDSSDIAMYSHPLESTGYREAEKIYNGLRDDQEDNAKKYNGAIGEVQTGWIENQLKEAQAQSQKVICFIHIPLKVTGAAKYTLWNSEDITDLLSSYSCVKAVVAGHHHEGGYSPAGGLHHITLKGMVQGEDTSYAILEIYDDKIIINGFGRETDMEYKYR